MAKPRSKFRKGSDAYWARVRVLQKINYRIRAGKSFHDLQGLQQQQPARESCAADAMLAERAE